MDQLVASFIARTMFDPFEWGVCDCIMWPSSLVLDATGVDPARDYRGTYSTAMGCRQLLIRHGGLVNLARKHMPTPAEELQTGVCILRHEAWLMGGIMSGGVAHLKTKNGVIKVHEPAVIVGWAV